MQWLPGAIFQQDNARPHGEKVSQDCVRTATTLSWPTQSPNLSPIDHIWDLLGRFRLQRDNVLDESRSFFRVHTGYFSNIPKCIKAEFIASWACSQSNVVSSSKR
ncbi:transposable element Tcb2 transposase [Trichonephila clavipes]|uniref:Transposable element Tcb2 transposase n=1 Tax=Trichonephila clavipes TaxID=2585209 RepID=A0A8X6RH98_TRICX|nr:transposable element Tcb2 transposase [Trichonephila clavipes]